MQWNRVLLFKNRIIICISLLYFMGIQVGNAQTNANDFPTTWLGEWTGELVIFGPEGERQRVPMSLLIENIDTSANWTWQLSYGSGDKLDQRPYELVLVDLAKGHYVIDEKNSIVLDVYHIAGKIFSRFEVMGNLLLITYEKKGEELLFEVISGRETDKKQTGGQELDGQEIPIVHSYPISIRQTASLKRKN